MNEVWNVYCDESCHLENDGYKAMVLGAVYCPQLRAREIALRIRDIKAEFGLPPHFEIKWTKVSKGNLPFYRRLIDYFFDDVELRFRALIISDKRSYLPWTAFAIQFNHQQEKYEKRWRRHSRK